LFQTILNRKHVRQMFAYPDSAIGFIQTNFLLALLVSWGYQMNDFIAKWGDTCTFAKCDYKTTN